MKRLLYLLPLLFLFSACSPNEDKTQVPVEEKSSFERVASVADASDLHSGPDGIYVLRANGVSFLEDKKVVPWLDLSSRSQQVWSIDFSPNWDKDQLFYVYYNNMAGGASLSEGLSGLGEGSWRRLIMRSPNPIGGSIVVNYRTLLYTDGEELLRIDPYINSKAAYSIPKGNPRGKELWAQLPPGRWEIAVLEDDVLIWGESESGQYMLWQEPLSRIREKTLLAKTADWKDSQCSLLPGYSEDDRYFFVSSCRGEILSWSNQEMSSTKEFVPNLISLTADEESIYALTADGEILVKQKASR